MVRLKANDFNNLKVYRAKKESKIKTPELIDIPAFCLFKLLI